METVNGVIAHRATLAHDEVMSAAIASRARRPHSALWYYAGLALALFAASYAAGPLAFMLVQQLPISWMFAVGPYLPTIVLALAGLTGVGLVAWAYLGAARRKLLREFARLGIPLEIEGLYEVLPDGLRLTTERIQIFPRWAAIDTIEPVRHGWALSADQLTFLLPSASFAEEGEERAFLAAIVERLDDAARERSGAAVRFAAGL